MITNFKLFEQKQDDWKLILNISKIWKDSIYENSNELELFNNQYINFLNQQKNLIIEKTSTDVWTKLEELILRLNENKNNISESSSIWDDIYDWADANLVEIKTETELKKDF
jgi:hypothetical protein